MKKYLLLLLNVFALTVTKAQYSPDNTTVYNLIRDSATKFPKPKFKDTINVGTLNIETGEFQGLISTVKEMPGRRPPFVKLDASAASVSPVHVLKFSVNSNTPDFSVILNGIPFQNKAGDKNIYITVTAQTDNSKKPFKKYGDIEIKYKQYKPDQTGNGTAIPIRYNQSVTWKIKSGNISFNDKLIIRKLPFIAAGVMKIPFLPVALLYEPSPDRNRTNSTSYSIENIHGSTVSLTFREGESKKVPESVPSETYKNILGIAAQGLSSSSDPYSQAAGVVLKGILSGWGSKKISTLTGTESSQQVTFKNIFSSTDTYSTGPNDGGPGIGDIIYCLKNCRVLWLIYNDSLKITLLDSETPFPVPFTALVLKGLVNTNKVLFEPIANCDPFIKYGLAAPLPAARYRYLGEQPIYGQGGPATHEWKTIVEKSDLQSSMKYSVRVEEVEAGWLSSLGLSSNNETATTTMETSQSLSNETQTGQVIKTSMSFNLAVDEIATYGIYFDKVFGTFVIRQISIKRVPDRDKR